MKYTPKRIKKFLKECIEELSNKPELFAKNPGKHFSRKRKLPFNQMINLILSMAGKSIRGELMDFFYIDTRIPTVSAFVQQRNKMDYHVFETLFHKFTNSIDEKKTFNGYRLLAIDASDIHVPGNIHEHNSSYLGANGQKPYNLIHLNALYDLQRNIYTDVILEGKRRENSVKAFADMVDRSDASIPTIYIADRGYEAYNTMAHVQEKGQKFVIRAKDFSYGGIAYGLDLPQYDEFDEEITLRLTKKQEARHNPNLKFLSASCAFDYLPTSCTRNTPITPYELRLRVVRFKLTENTSELILTNLNKEDFSSEDIKELYAMRWGIETSFRNLKHTLSLMYFKSKKTEYIFQEIFAKLTMYNFAELITSHVVVKQKNRKYPYRINFSAAVHICRNFFLKNISPSVVEALLLQYLLPIRHGLSTPRVKHYSNIPSFNYRIP